MSVSNMTELLSDLREMSFSTEVDQKGKDALINYSKYLLSSIDNRKYADLYEFLTWFGKSYIYPEIRNWVKDLKDSCGIGQVYDMGCGTGWLGSAIKDDIANLPVIGIDKRDIIQFGNLDSHWIYDIESNDGFMAFRTRVKASFHKPVYIGSHFLHCIDNWIEIIQTFKGPWIIVEPTLQTGLEPYGKQLALSGSVPLLEKIIEKAFLDNGYQIGIKERIEDQTLWMFLTGKECFND